MSEAIKQRRSWVAVLLALLFSPFTAMLYLNRGRPALLYLLADTAIALVVLSVHPLKPGHSPDALIWLAQLPVLAIGLVHAFAILRRWDPAQQRRWYSRWYSITGILLCFPITALVIRAFLFQPFDVRSSSMSPTLNQGDYFWASKFAYRWTAPMRGDVIVFRAPALGGDVYVKRIVGLPGERIAMRSGILYINDTPTVQREAGNYAEDCGQRDPCRVPRFMEVLPGGGTEYVLEDPEDNTPEFIVPPANYFVLGDNRDNSRDSRNGMGFIRLDDILGRASRKFIENGHWTWKPVN